ncbi:MAG: ABC transporter ATP-binding protein [Burkholderiaceae bacterium]
MLRAKGLTVSYKGSAALAGLDLELNAGEVMAIVGSNGAGKSTTLKAISRVVPAGGELTLDGRSLMNCSPREVVEAGVVHVPEGRRVFATLTVRENLLMGAITRPKSEWQASLRRMGEIFPVLDRYSNRLAGLLSGGEQQMLALGRALMARPRVLMLDEPSLGLSPLMVQSVAKLVRELRGPGIAILLVEQNASLALALADKACVLERGRVVVAGTSEQLRRDSTVRSIYLGVAGKAAEGV